MNEPSSSCGCKGIRTCLLCEKEKNISFENEVVKEIEMYNYCPYCNLCWPDGDDCKYPLYLGELLLIPEFVTEKEESYLVSSIDQVQWMPSQSGRRKQDFGPRANFKKKKVKLSDFKGFPIFVKEFITRLSSVKELADFSPVELCNLEYTPDRGSAIEPHIDDLWLWGPRLVTINLLSETVLTLTPTTTGTCLDWQPEMQCDNIYSRILNDHNLEEKSNIFCHHKFSFKDLKANNPSQIKSLCSDYHNKEMNNKSIAVSVNLPPRSLFVLSGCARSNWFHEIKRSDVTSRRLAMTFRELSETVFTENKETKELCDELLMISKQYLAM